jgi:sugar/nucleoside kinase (ribokinase family)
MSINGGTNVATVVCLGVHILDILGRPVERIPPRQDIDLLEEIRLTVAGTAAGTSVDLAKLSVDVVAMGAIGADEAGHFVLDTMGRYGIDTSALRIKANVQTSATMLPIRPNGERPALHVLGANAELTFEDVDLGVIERAKVLHLGGTCLMPKFDGEPSLRVLEHAKEHGVITTHDVLAVPRPDLLDIIAPLMPYVDYFMPGIDEAKMIAGMPDADRKEVIRFFLDLGTKHTVFKMGAEGSSIGWLEDGEVREIRLPAHKVPVVDSTGCGDAYCAGFITGLTKGWDLEQAGRLGTAASAQVITGLGSDAGIVDLDSTIEFMNTAETYALSESS